MKTERRGFTMIELMVVIGVMLILASMTYAMLATGKNTGKIREAARIGQSAFLGAKDRATHAKDLRGVRFIRDQTDNTLVTALVYLQPLPLQIYVAGSVQLERIDLTTTATGAPPPDGFADSNDILIVRGFDASSPGAPANFVAVDWAQKAQFFPSPFRVRIPSANGQWFLPFSIRQALTRLEPETKSFSFRRLSPSNQAPGRTPFQRLSHGP